jgi:predicted nucleic acid-binding protein
MIFVDSGFFLALVRPRDSLYQRAQAWAQAIQEPLAVTEYVLLETANPLSSTLDRPKFHTLLARIGADPNI